MPIDLQVTGAAAKTTVSGTMTPGSPGGGGTFTVASASGYPPTGKFSVTIDRGLASEEKILINSRSGAVFTVGQRGYDGTSAADHANGAFCELSLPALVVQALIDHENGTAANPHDGVLLDNADHDVVGRHTYGAAYGPGTALPTTIAPDDTAGAGTGANPARSDHRHAIVAATAATITGTNAEGASTSFARADHNHVIGGTNHIPVAAMVNGSIANGAAALATGQSFTYIQAGNPGAVGANALWFNTTKRTLLVRNAANTQWEVISSHGLSIEYTPTLTNIAIGTGAALNKARYRRHGNTIIADGFVMLGTGGDVTGQMAVSLPVAAKSYSGTYAQFYFHGAIRATDTSVAFAAVGLVGVGTSFADVNTITFFSTAGTGSWNGAVPWDWQPGYSFSWFVEYEPASLEDANFV